MIQSQIFFLISSIGFTILGILVGIIIVYILSIIKSFSKILKIIEKDIDSIGDTPKIFLKKYWILMFFVLFLEVGLRKITKINYDKK